MFDKLRQIFSVSRAKVHFLKTLLLCFSPVSAVLGVLLDEFGAKSDVADFAIRLAWVVGALGVLVGQWEYVIDKRALLAQQKAENDRHEELLSQIRRAVSPLQAPLFFCDVAIALTEVEKNALSNLIGQAGRVITRHLEDPGLAELKNAIDGLALSFFAGELSRNVVLKRLSAPLNMGVVRRDRRYLSYADNDGEPMLFDAVTGLLRFTIAEETIIFHNSGELNAIADLFGKELYLNVLPPVRDRVICFGDGYFRFPNGQKLGISDFVPNRGPIKTSLVGRFSSGTLDKHHHPHLEIHKGSIASEVVADILQRRSTNQIQIESPVADDAAHSQPANAIEKVDEEA